MACDCVVTPCVHSEHNAEIARLELRLEKSERDRKDLRQQLVSAKVELRALRAEAESQPLVTTAFAQAIRDERQAIAAMLKDLPAHERLWGDEHVLARNCVESNGHTRNAKGRCDYCNLKLPERT